MKIPILQELIKDIKEDPSFRDTLIICSVILVFGIYFGVSVFTV